MALKTPPFRATRPSSRRSSRGSACGPTSSWSRRSAAPSRPRPAHGCWTRGASSPGCRCPSGRTAASDNHGGTEYASDPGARWVGGTAKRRCDRALGATAGPPGGVRARVVAGARRADPAGGAGALAGGRARLRQPWTPRSFRHHCVYFISDSVYKIYRPVSEMTLTSTPRLRGGVVPRAGRGGARARSHCRFAVPLTHFIPYSLTYSVPLLLKRRCGRTPGGCRAGGHDGGRAAAGGGGGGGGLAGAERCATERTLSARHRAHLHQFGLSASERGSMDRLCPRS
jgi:hypothetical protein